METQTKDTLGSYSVRIIWVESQEKVISAVFRLIKQLLKLQIFHR